jgi:hypothetical protein
LDENSPNLVTPNPTNLFECGEYENIPKMMVKRISETLLSVDFRFISKENGNDSDSNVVAAVLDWPQGDDQGCQIFLDPIYQNGENIYQMTTTLPNVHKIYQMSVKYSKLP